jgi:hypothetical protein
VVFTQEHDVLELPAAHDSYDVFPVDVFPVVELVNKELATQQ